jgi:hypothetical protein
MRTLLNLAPLICQAILLLSACSTPKVARLPNDSFLERLVTCENELPSAEECLGSDIRHIASSVWLIVADKKCFSVLAKSCVIEENGRQKVFKQ